MNRPGPESVLRLVDVDAAAVERLLARFGLTLEWLAPETVIPGSYWGEEEAGLIGDRLYVRADTPVHSLLHEACHWIVMDPAKRPDVHTDASDCQLEENATCYLQVLLADHIDGFGRARACADMDAWGYSFRLGSAAAWFAAEADDAAGFLKQHGLIDGTGRPTWRIRS